MGKRLRDDGGLFEELAYCVPKGLPHSFFLGGKNRWTQDDRDKAIAYERELHARCSTCGTHPRDWERDRDAYIGDVTHCEGCARIELEQDNDVSKRKGAKIRLLPHGEAVRRTRQGQILT